MPFSAAIVECYKQIGACSNSNYFKEQVKALLELQKAYAMKQAPMAIPPAKELRELGVRPLYPVPEYSRAVDPVRPF
jgi:hypothetical protein